MGNKWGFWNDNSSGKQVHFKWRKKEILFPQIYNESLHYHDKPLGIKQEAEPIGLRGYH